MNMLKKKKKTLVMYLHVNKRAPKPSLELEITKKNVGLLE
jgi:hypothetical protein